MVTIYDNKDSLTIQMTRREALGLIEALGVMTPELDGDLEGELARRVKDFASLLDGAVPIMACKSQ